MAVRLFGNGWAFFLPYLAVYLAAIAIGLTNGSLRRMYWLLHVILVLLFFRWLWRQDRSRLVVSPPLLAGWLCLGLVFLWAGAYLEFPGDPWEHLRRLNSFNEVDRVRNSPLVFKFVYPWGWSLLSLVQPRHLRLALALYSAFWQLLLAAQLYLFFRRLKHPPLWAFLQVLGAVAFFGLNVFSFFRYYALSSTPLAYIAYLRGAIAFLDLLEHPARRISSTLVIAACLLLMALNHRQELLLFALLVAAAGSMKVWGILSRGQRAAALTAGIALWVGGMVSGRFLATGHAFSGMEPRRLEPFWVSGWGIYRLWDPQVSGLACLGAVGVAGVLIAVLAPRCQPLLATLTLLSIGVLLFPPYAVAVAHTENNLPAAYRVLFVLPPAALPLALFAFIDSRLEVRRRQHWLRGLALATILALGLLSRPPFYGKLDFVFLRPPREATVAWIDDTAQWFAQNRKASNDCVIVSDGLTELALASFLGRLHTFNRVTGGHVFMGYEHDWDEAAPEDLRLFKPSWGNVPIRLCGFLVLEEAMVHRPQGPYFSWVGWHSGHWQPTAADLAGRMPKRFKRDALRLVEHGWRQTAVPPFYWLIEPPQ